MCWLAWTVLASMSRRLKRSQEVGRKKSKHFKSRGINLKRVCHWCSFRGVCGGKTACSLGTSKRARTNPPVRMTPPWIEVKMIGINKYDFGILLQIGNPKEMYQPLVGTETLKAQIPQLMRINNTELVLCCNPNGLVFALSQRKSLFVASKRFKHCILLVKRGYICWLDPMACSAQDATALSMLGRELGCNVKIGQSFPW